MPDAEFGEITQLLKRLRGGEREALANLLPLVYEELHVLAEQQMAHERSDHTLQPTALIHEAYLRLAGRPSAEWVDRRHFFRAAAVVMRHLLVSHARQRNRLKRGAGAVRMGFDEALAMYEDRAIDLLALDEALVRLEAREPRQSSVVELRFFTGLSNSEVAEVLGVSQRTVEGDWAIARAWLLREVGSA